MAERTQITKKQFNDAWYKRIGTELIAQEKALPQNFNKARFTQNCVALLNDKPELLEYGDTQVVVGLVKGAILGLDFFMHECYLIPYGKILNFQTDYKGEIKFHKRHATRPIVDIYAEVVREGDVLTRYIKDGQHTVDFTPRMFNKAPIIGAFAVCLFKDGGKMVEVMNIDELNKAREKSKNANKGAWKDFTSEMYKKVVLRRLCKHLDFNFDNDEQFKIYEEVMAIETDPEKIVKADVAENANTEEFKEI